MRTYIFQGSAIFDARSNRGVTALHVATSQGNADFVKLLVECGASTHCKETGLLYPILPESVRTYVVPFPPPSPTNAAYSTQHTAPQRERGYVSAAIARGVALALGFGAQFWCKLKSEGRGNRSKGVPRAPGPPRPQNRCLRACQKLMWVRFCVRSVARAVFLPSAYFVAGSGFRCSVPAWPLPPTHC